MLIATLSLTAEAVDWAKVPLQNELAALGPLLLVLEVILSAALLKTVVLLSALGRETLLCTTESVLVKLELLVTLSVESVPQKLDVAIRVVEIELLISIFKVTPEPVVVVAKHVEDEFA